MTSNTMEDRYEVGADDVGVIAHVSKFDEAVRVATDFIEREGMPVTIFDRMAHKGKPELWDVVQCHGEAHKNPFIDNCCVCAPYWEYYPVPRNR